MNLNLGVKLTDSTGQENMPVTERILLEFPKATVNGDKFPKCTASDGDAHRARPVGLPARLADRSGVAHVRGIALPFTADIKLFNGKGTNKDREIVIYAKERSLEVVVILRGKLRQINRGDFGFEFDLTIPPNAIQLLSDQFVAIEDFEVKVGKRIKRNGRLISYIDAPRKCTGNGWPFTFRNELRGGAVVTDSKRISCVIKAHVTALRVVSVVGTRPNFMKTAPIAAELARRAGAFEHVLVHTGQHYDDAMSRGLLRGARRRRAGRACSTSAPARTPQQTARVMERLEPVLLELEPDVVLVPGDVNSTLAAALVAAKLGMPRRARRGRPAHASTARCPRRSTASSPTRSPTCCSSTRPRRASNLLREGAPGARRSTTSATR